MGLTHLIHQSSAFEMMVRKGDQLVINQMNRVRRFGMMRLKVITCTTYDGKYYQPKLPLLEHNRIVVLISLPIFKMAKSNVYSKAAA